MHRSMFLIGMLGFSLLACDGPRIVTVERGTITLSPTRLATYTHADGGSEGWCLGQLDRRPAPRAAQDSDLGPAEAATGFANSYGGSDICRRRNSVVQTAIVEFDLSQLWYEPGLVTFDGAVLHYTSRPLRSQDGAPSITDGLLFSHCPRLVEWREPFLRGWQRADSRDELRGYVEDSRLINRVRPVVDSYAVELSDYLGRRPQRRNTLALALTSDSELRYSDTNAFCAAIVGDFRLSFAYERVVSIEPAEE